jgi:digeranylgeranylglycerophospholipid reductase
MKSYDCIIVGGGPVGCYTAQNIAKKGFSTSLYEEHPEIGRPVKCAGLVTKRVLDFCHPTSSNSVLLPINGAHIHSPSGEVLTIGGDAVHAYVIDRVKFDRCLMKRALNNGTEINIDRKVTSVKIKADKIVCTYQQDNKISSVQSQIIIGADGPHSIVRRSFTFPKPAEFLRGIGADVSNISLDPQFVEIFINTRYAPGFFAWVIPTNITGTTARIGLCVSSKYSKLLKNGFNKFQKEKILRDVKIESYVGGEIPLGPLKKTTLSQVMLVGDAAAQIKPTSGGGLYPGLCCARRCADVAINALEEGLFDQRILRRYHQRWTQEIGRELDKGMQFRRLYVKCTNKEISKILHLLNTPKILHTIQKFGDIDHPSRLVMPLMKTAPSFIRGIPSVFI